jgi:hypothetical protein
MSNTTDYTTHTVEHRGDFANAAMVRACAGAISLTHNGLCIRCGYPTIRRNKQLDAARKAARA